MLAFHTISQLGFILAAPLVGGFYALTHGLVKSALFLIAGILPSRNFKQLHHQPIETKIWLALVIASFSISGFPLLAGFGAKVLTTKNLLPWQVIAMNIAAVGTAISFAKFIFLPRRKLNWRGDELVGEKTDEGKKIQIGFWGAMVVLLGGLIAANGVYYEAYTVNNLVKPLATIAIGWSIYLLVVKKIAIKLSRAIEKFEHLIGVMSLTLIIIFWIVWTRIQFST